MMQVLQVGYSLENKVVFSKPGMCVPDSLESFLSTNTENVFLFQNVLCWRIFYAGDHLKAHFFEISIYLWSMLFIVGTKWKLSVPEIISFSNFHLFFAWNAIGFEVLGNA